MAAEADAHPGMAGSGRLGSWAAVLGRLKSNAFRRMGWGLADQMVSSLTNFAVSIYVVRSLGAVQFGAFSLTYVTYGFALNASRGLSTDPLMVRFSGSSLTAWRRAVAMCTGTALTVGMIIGACILAAGALVGGKAGAGFVALGLTLPGLMLQDSWRYSFFAIGRGSQAFINDAIWGATLVPALVLLRDNGHANVFSFVLCWGVTACIAAAAGPFQARVIPRLPGAWDWLRQHRDLGLRYLAEGTSSSVSGQLRTYCTGGILGLAAVGYVQAASTLTGPMAILFLGMSLTTIPEAARVLRRSPRHLPLFSVIISAGLSVAGIAWGVVLIFVLPHGFGHWLLGSVWRPTYPLVWLQTLYIVGQASGFGAGVALHALGAARRSLWAMVAASSASLAFGVAGAALDGAAGAIAGAAIAAWLGSVLLWWQLRSAMRESAAVVAGQAATRTYPGRDGPSSSVAPPGNQH
jgi:O-antigen/teichoic acid export membrane protein